MKRCVWAKENDALMMEYHDNEYGRRKGTDEELFEKLCLEIFQAGLSWRTVLSKREAFRQRFFNFDIDKVASINQSYIEEMLCDERIIRNRRKIDAVVHNANMHIIYFRDKDSFKDYVYSFTDKDALTKDLKKKGYRFVGPTICESFLMSVGAIEGHEPQCYLYKGAK